MEFKLNDKEVKKLKKWQNAIKEIHGKYGNFTYKFSPTGIGDAIFVYSELIDKEIELTDFDSW